MYTMWVDSGYGYWKPHDWYYIRHADNATAVPSAVQTYRDGVRTKAADFETAIASTASNTDLQNVDLGTGWPSEPEV